MTYTYDLPSALLMKETNISLRALGCAVTADKELAARERAGKTRASIRSPKQTGAAFVLGKVHADE